MASHCQCHHQTHRHLHQPTNYSSCCCSTHPSPPFPHSHHSPTTTTSTDPLVQAIATQLLQSSQSHLFSNYHQLQPQHHHPQQTQTQLLFTSLIRRIDALESSLHHLSPSPSPSPPPPSPYSLRDLAARTIQTHFRAYLVRRSRTLRHLKHLAIVKSNLNALKSSLSDKPHFNYQPLSHKAMDLLLKLDTIQGGDPMVRDGKKSISRELVRFLEFIDGASIKSHQLSSKPKKKNVRFSQKISESRAYIDTKKPVTYEDVIDMDDQRVSSDDQQKLVENLCRRVEEIEGLTRISEENEEEEANVEENEGPSHFRNGDERIPRKNVKLMGNYGNGSHSKGQRNGSFVFSPPLPVQMESREDELVKRELR